MAKRKKKHATALFEVMSAGKSLELPEFKSRSRVNAPSWLTRWRQHRAAAAEAKAARAAERASMPAPVEYAPPPPPPRMEIKPEPVAVDIAEPETGEKKPFPFKIDFTTGVIIASGVVCFVGLTMLIGQKLGNPAKPPLMAAQDKPKNSSVMDVTRKPVQQAQAQQPSPEDHPPIVEQQQQAPAAPGKRVMNMNYVVIQSFPEEKLARDAAEYLNKNGIPCTVIQSLARWTNKTQWYSIVGMKPFPPRSTGTAAYEAYVTQIKDVGTKFAGKSKWNRFEPQPYRWGTDSEK